MLFVEANGARIPAIGLGTWELSGSAPAARVVEQALRLGYRHIDTAQVYEQRARGRRRPCAPRACAATTSSSPPRSGPTISRPTISSARSRRASPACGFPPSISCCCTGPIRMCRWRRRWARWRMRKTMGLTRHIGVSNFTVALIEQAVGVCRRSRWSATRSNIIPISTRRR